MLMANCCANKKDTPKEQPTPGPLTRLAPNLCNRSAWWPMHADVRTRSTRCAPPLVLCVQCVSAAHGYACVPHEQGRDQIRRYGIPAGDRLEYALSRLEPYSAYSMYLIDARPQA